MPVHAQQLPPQRPDSYPVKSIRIILGIAPDGSDPGAATSPVEFRAIFTEEFSKREKFFRTAELKDMAR